TRDFSRLGCRRHTVSAWVLSGSCDAGIRRPFWRNNSSPAAAPFLLPASLAQIFPVERADNCNRVGRSRLAQLATALRVVRYRACNCLAALLEHRRTDCDVADSIKARRSHFPGDSAALFAVGGANWCGPIFLERERCALAFLPRRRLTLRHPLHRRLHQLENPNQLSRSSRRARCFWKKYSASGGCTSLALRSGFREGRRPPALLAKNA